MHPVQAMDSESEGGKTHTFQITSLDGCVAFVLHNFFDKELGSALSIKSSLISFLYSRPILTLLFQSRTLLGKYEIKFVQINEWLQVNALF